MSVAPLPPVAPVAPKPMFSPRDSHMMKSYLLGGAALGGGVGLLTSLANYLGSIKEEGDDANKDTDDDTLYLNLRRRPGVKAASLAGSISLAGGTMTTLGAYAAVHSLYQKMKKKEVQARLDAAQQGYIDTLGAQTDATKMAGINPAAVDGKPMGWTEGLLSTPGAAALLLGITSAGITNQMLKKTFPVAKPALRTNPRRVVVRSVDDDKNKQASTDGEELVYRLLMATKSAALQPFQDLIAGIAQGRRDEIRHGLTNYGIDTCFDMVKGASSQPISDFNLSLACGVAANDDLLSPTLGLLAAAEFNDHFPSAVKVAMALPEVHHEALCKSACLIGATMRAEACSEYANTLPDGEADKQASGVGLKTIIGADVLNDLLISKMTEHNGENGVQMEGDMANSETTLKRPKTNVMADDPQARQFENQHKDMIDAALAG